MKMSTITCNVDECERAATHSDDKGFLYCDEHWQKRDGISVGFEPAKDPCVSGCKDCNECAPTCAVPGCNEIGIVMQFATGKAFCIQHAWKLDRPEEEPVFRAEWNKDDVEYLHSLGIKFGNA